MRRLFQSPSSLPRQQRRTPIASGRSYRASRATRFNAFFFLLVLSLGGSLILLWRLQLQQWSVTEDGNRLALSEKVTETNVNAGKAGQAENKGSGSTGSSGSSSSANGGDSNLNTPLLDADADDDYDDGDFLSVGSTDATSAGVEEGAGAAGKRAANGGEDEESADSIRKYEICKRLIQRPPLVCAHGGDSSSAPPNSVSRFPYPFPFLSPLSFPLSFAHSPPLPTACVRAGGRFFLRPSQLAFERAVAAGADAVEVDASLTADGHLVALHDRDVQSLLNDPSARVPSLVYSQIRQLDLSPLWPATSPRDPAMEQIPVLTLQQALQALIGRVKHIAVDVKIATSAIAENRHMAQRLLNVFERVGGCAECLVWSKEDQFIRHLSRIQPSIRADWVHKSLATLQTVNDAHKGGKEVHVWTVDDRAGMRRVLGLPVDVVVTNNPVLLRKTISRFQKQCKHAGLG
ncbi:unnamed protein product [Closterium sp. Yama58-4]|nr:unnamed protein product [Closterium sp. Yama58-4]